MWRPALALVLAVIFATPTWADAPNGGAAASKLAPYGRTSWPAEKKRAWLQAKILGGSADAAKTQAVQNRLDGVTAKQLDELVLFANRQQRELDRAVLAEKRAELAKSKAYRDQLVRQYQQRLAAARHRGVGFAPVVTWLPEGASLGAGAVISPDRRYVRINAMPFFSHIPEVATFNMANGQYRVYRNGYPQHSPRWPSTGGHDPRWPKSNPKRR